MAVSVSKPQAARYYLNLPGTGLSLRELLFDLRYQTLVLFKCLLLQRRVSLKCSKKLLLADILCLGALLQRKM